MAEYMKKGEVIPKELVFSYLEKELSDPKYRRGFILDGYPKALEFYQHLMPLLDKLGYEPLAAIHFDISKELAIQRLTGRLHCAGCAKDFHVVYLPPKQKGVCDDCSHSLESRSDDTLAAIEKRLNVFDTTTKPVLKKFEETGILSTIDASQPPKKVRKDIISLITDIGLRRTQEAGSYYLREPIGKEKSSIFHNHIDARSYGVLHDIIRKVEAVSSDFQNKIYPVAYLKLGPQITDPEFASVYQELPNFHPISGAIDEAFSTGKMGDEGFNYDQIRATLNAAFAFPHQGVMTELEEEIFNQEYDEEGKVASSLNRGFTPTTIDWTQLPGWKDKMIANVPRFELHHGFDIPKKEGETTPPIDLNLLSEVTAKLGIQTGGWFIFRKKGVWAYRSNEFANGMFESTLERLQEQTDRLRGLVKAILPKQPFTSSCSLEKVHAIWRIS
jgi:adenylate kinase